MKKLAVTIGGDVREVPLPVNGELAVGRLSANDIVIPDQSVSRRHAVVRVMEGVVIIEDVGSHHGTRVNGEKIASPSVIEAGDEIAIGGAVISLLDTDSPRGTEDLSASPPAPVVVERVDPQPAAVQPIRDRSKFFTPELLALQSKIHAIILARINAGEKAANLAADRDLSTRARQCLDEVLLERKHELPGDVALEDFREILVDELFGYGPISPMLRDPAVSEIMVNGPERIFIESKGLLYETGAKFLHEAHLVQIIKRIVEPLGRHVDDASPMVDARLPDGSRVNAVVPPLAIDGASMTIRKFSERKLTTDDLIDFGSMTREMALFLKEAVRQRQNILVSGGTGSGKTTLLNILSQFIPEGERLVTIEDSAELKLSHRNIVRLEARPANVEGKGRVTIRDLVVNSLRMRPDRIIVGECRGAEALDMLQAMNTGHDGSLTTAHANSPRDAMSRLENMVMMAGYELPSSAIRDQIASAIDIVVQQSRMADGTRKIVRIVEITGREEDAIQMQDIFEFRQTGYDPSGRVLGYYTATGNIPRFVEDLRERGTLSLDASVFVPKN